MEPVTFASPDAFRRWLLRHHASSSEIVLRLIRKHAGVPGLTHREALDEALCHGWIDGVLHPIDEVSFSVRFTPRRKSSHWSAVNLRRFAELEAQGRVHPAGRAVYDSRD